MLSKFVNIPVFIASLALGLFFVYVYVPDSKTIYVYPTPQNVSEMQYKDIVGNCYHYVEQQVDCPSDTQLSVVPPQS